MKKGRISKQSFLAISILLLSSSLCFGKTINVGVGLGYDYSSIQPAIDAAVESDTIIVAQGMYEGSINFKGKNITLTSTENNNWDVIQKTIIRTNSGSVVTFSGNESSSCTLQGVTISNGEATYGGGINGNGTKATIRRCNIHGNEASSQGGGLYNCDGLIDDCKITNNNSFLREATTYGGGLYGCDGTIKNSIINYNGAGFLGNLSINPGQGGGLFSCNGQIINCTIEGNRVIENGGGLNSCNALISNCIIKDNDAGYRDAPGSGGGLYNCNADINNCTIQNNTATNEGGGLYGCNGKIINCTIQNNTSSNQGGGLYACHGTISGCTIKTNTSSGDTGGGLANCMGAVENCTIQGNTSPLWHAGGAIDCNSFKNCIITGNSTRGYGGGLYLCNKVLNCKISGNSSEIYPGGGLAYCTSVINCIISGNTAGGEGGGLYNCKEIVNCTIVGNYSRKNAAAVYFKGDYGIIDNTIIWDNVAVDGGQVIVAGNEPNTALWNLSIDYSDVQGGPNSVGAAAGAVLRWEPNNLDIYPLFKQPGSWNNTTHKWTEGDYHLLNNSVCIDAGDPNRNYADQNDIDNGPRVFGLYVDIGADESVYVPPVFVQIEITGPTQVNESNEAQYSAIGRFNDNSQINLTKDAAWSVEPAGVGTIDANGLFTVGDLNDSREVTIKASYTPAGQQTLFIAQMTVLCVNVPEPNIPEPVVTYYVDTATGNDQNSGLSRQTAFKTIQTGINTANDGDTVLVYPGIYRECVIFRGKNITLRSEEGAAVIENPDSIAVLFCFGETNQCKIQNFIIRNSNIGILSILNSSPVIKNLTIVNNNTGIDCVDSSPAISNCILWYNTEKDFVNCIPSYSCTEDPVTIETFAALHNIHSNPLFADPNAGDYHLKSERGRYWPLYNVWVLDDVSSPCIDAGNPNDAFSKERQPNGGRINMGAYGNTSQASMSMTAGEQYKASQPNPHNGVADVSLKPTLSWTAGLNAVLHDIYLGTNLDNVRNATRENTLGVLASQGKSAPNFVITTSLNYNKMYFWRVDEIDSQGTITKGDIWVFLTLESPSKGTRSACFIGQVPVWLDGKTAEISKASAGQNAAISGPRHKVITLQEHEGS